VGTGRNEWPKVVTGGWSFEEGFPYPIPNGKGLRRGTDPPKKLSLMRVVKKEVLSELYAMHRTTDKPFTILDRYS